MDHQLNRLLNRLSVDPLANLEAPDLPSLMNRSRFSSRSDEYGGDPNIVSLETDGTLDPSYLIGDMAKKLIEDCGKILESNNLLENRRFPAEPEEYVLFKEPTGNSFLNDNLYNRPVSRSESYLYRSSSESSTGSPPSSTIKENYNVRSTPPWNENYNFRSSPPWNHEIIASQEKNYVSTNTSAEVLLVSSSPKLQTKFVESPGEEKSVHGRTPYHYTSRPSNRAEDCFTRSVSPAQSLTDEPYFKEEYNLIVPTLKKENRFVKPSTERISVGLSTPTAKDVFSQQLFTNGSRVSAANACKNPPKTVSSLANNPTMAKKSVKPLTRNDLVASYSFAPSAYPSSSLPDFLPRIMVPSSSLYFWNAQRPKYFSANFLEEVNSRNNTHLEFVENHSQRHTMNLFPLNKKPEDKFDSTQQSQGMFCRFCKSNYESEEVYSSHTLRKRIGRKLILSCPILRRLKCVKCGKSGDDAHTISYCPLVIAENGKKPISVAAEIKKTKRIACGKLRTREN